MNDDQAKLERARAWVLALLKEHRIRVSETSIAQASGEELWRLELRPAFTNDPDEITAESFLEGNDEYNEDIDPDGYNEEETFFNMLEIEAQSEYDLWMKSLLNVLKRFTRVKSVGSKRITDNYFRTQTIVKPFFKSDVSNCTSWEQVILQEAVAGS